MKKFLEFGDVILFPIMAQITRGRDKTLYSCKILKDVKHKSTGIITEKLNSETYKVRIVAEDILASDRVYFSDVSNLIFINNSEYKIRGFDFKINTFKEDF